jgi:RHS repeat-associated protein
MSNIRYTATGQVASWQWADGTTYQKTYTVDGKLKTFPLGNATRTLRYDTVGNITGWDDNGDAAKAKQFRYDLLDRLEGYTAATEAQAFQYDPNGNRTAKVDNGNTTTYGFQPTSNRLTYIGSNPQMQDANGNLLNDGSHTYTYNAQNRLANVDSTTFYTYNAEEQRVRKTTSQGVTLYAWDNDRIIGEYGQNGAGQQATETVYFGSTPVALIQNGAIYRIYADQIGTPRVITDLTGKTVWMWESNPFGETKPNEDPDQDGLKLTYHARFPGQVFDSETGLHYNFHRDYNPQTGRYMQSDPIGLEGGLNTFGYANMTVLTNSDASGLKPIVYKDEALRKLYQPIEAKIALTSVGKTLMASINNRKDRDYHVYRGRGVAKVGRTGNTLVMEIDPNFLPEGMMIAVQKDTKGKWSTVSGAKEKSVKPSRERVFAHELGHLVLNTDEMTIVNTYENPIAREWDKLHRTRY